MIEENERLGSLLKYELDRNYSRVVAPIAKGQNLKMGTVVSKNATDGTYQMLSLSGESADGTNKAIGILLEDVDATEASKKALILSRIGIVEDAKLIYPVADTKVEVTEEQKKKIINELEIRGIVIRSGGQQ